MLNMQNFHKLLCGSSESREPYLVALRSFTRISPAELIAMTSGLGWQPW
ncbi:MAG TPA: hypothetical protein VFI68_10530 [Anaerolineales bacterium]|nr:hypothetical protein [Anaerolineales bacterium]